MRPSGTAMAQFSGGVGHSAQDALPERRGSQASNRQPLIGNHPESNNARFSVLSMYYGAEAYLEESEKRLRNEFEISAMKEAAPDEKGPRSSVTLADKTSILAVKTDSHGRGKEGRRAFPTPNKPDPMPDELAFLFTKIAPEQMMYMWNVYTLIFFAQCASVVAYWFMLAIEFDWCLATVLFSIPMAMLMIQNVYILHDVIHGATFPPHDWQNYITHPFADFFSLPWSDVILQHNRHHASTVDLLIHGEFGWDPATWLYYLQEWTDKWYAWLTVPLVPVWHWLGANDTGALFAILWYWNFPDAGVGGKCNKEFWSKWLPRRVKHTVFVASLWACVWLLGTWPLGRPLREGWRFMLPVSCAARTGFTIAWVVFTNFNHSHFWNEFLALDPERRYPKLQRVMAMILGGRHRFNEMLFHDVHHAFPNAVGAMSQRGRFYGWERVHDAAVDVLCRGIWKAGYAEDQVSKMEEIQERRLHLMRNALVA